MRLEEKKEYVKKLKEKFKKSNAFILLENKGVDAPSMTEFRSNVRKLDGEFKIVKNTLAKRAIEEFSFNESLSKKLQGPVGIAFVYNDPVSVAKYIVNQIEDEELKFELKGGFLGDKELDVKDIKALSNLPSKDVLVAQFVGLLAAPIRNFLGVLQAVPRDFVLVLNAIKNKKEQK